MEPQENQPQPDKAPAQQVNTAGGLPIILISILITALLVGGGLFLWQKLEKGKMQQRINDLESSLQQAQGDNGILRQKVEELERIASESATQPPESAPTITQDTTPPTILGVSGVSEGSIVTDSSRLIITVMAKDNVTDSSRLQIRVKLNDGEWWDWSGDFRIYFGPLQDGNYIFRAQVRDEAENVSSSYQLNFQVKTD